MSLQTRITDLAAAIGADIKSINKANAPIDLVSHVRAPFYVSHRGGSLRFPEETKLGWSQSMEDGFWLECDLSPNADGDIVLMHDDTVNRTTNGTGTVASKTTEQWKLLSTNGPIPGSKRSPATTWEDMINQYGGRTILIPEMKSTWTQAQRDAFFADIIARKLQKSIIIQSFTYSYALEAVAHGIPALALGNSQTAAQMVADGMWGVGLSSGTAIASINAYKNAGLRVLIYTISTRADRDLWLGTNGMHGIFSDDAWWASKRFPSVSANTETVGDDWYTKVPWPGMIGNPQLEDLVANTTPRSPRGEFVGSRGLTPYVLKDTTVPSFTFGIPMNFVGPRGPNVIVRTKAFYGAVAQSQTRWGSIYWGAINPEVGFNDSSSEANGGYHFLFRRNGTLDLYNCPVNGAAVNIGTSTTGPVIASGNEAEVILELEVNPTNVVCRVIVGATTYSLSVANTLYRPTAGYAQLNENGQYVEFSDFSVRSI